MPSKKRVAAEKPAVNLEAQPVESVQPLNPRISSLPGFPRGRTDVPPNWNAEVMTLAIILSDPYALGWVHSRYLGEGDFWFPFPKAVFAAMVRIEQYGSLGDITFVTVRREVERKQGNSFSEHFQVLYQLLEIGRISRDVLLSFVLEVRNRSRLRQLEEAGRWVICRAEEGRDALAVAQNLVAELNALLQEWDEPQWGHPRVRETARGEFEA